MRIKKQVERWFEVENDPDKSKLLIKHLEPGEITDIMDSVVKQKVTYRDVGKEKAQPEFEQITDTKADREKTILATVKGWENIYDEAGEPLPFNEENILVATRRITGFHQIVNRFRHQLAADIAKEEAEEEKELEKN